MSLKAYTYKPLQSTTHVRRLRRVKNEAKDGLHFQIAQFDQISSSSPPYYSLSYTWGNPLDCDTDAETEAEWRDQHQIFLCEEDGVWSTLSVTTNLYDFLCEFSTADLDAEVSWIWIDAICINQGDVAERGVQVGLMREIYLSCAEVIIWLGREGEETAFMSYMITIAAAIPAEVYADYYESTKDDNSLQSLLDISRDLVRGGFPEPTDGVYRLLCMFLRRSWFHRIWTVQESVLPSKGQVWYGSHRITDMDSFSRIGLIARGYIEPLPMPDYGYSKTVVIALEYLRNFLFAGIPGDGKSSFLGGGITLDASTCLFYSRDKKCSVPHDHVYAILGLQGDELAQADYTITVKELYTKVALRPSIQPFVFENAGLGSNTGLERPHHNEDLPSWVPDWNSPLDAKSWSNYRPRGTYHAGGLHPHQFSITQISNSIIRCAGFKEDRVALLGGHGSPITPQTLLTCLQLLDTASTGAHPLLDPNNMVERLARTLTMKSKETPTDKLRTSFRGWAISELAYHLYDNKDEAEWNSVRITLENLLERDETATGFLPTWLETEKMAQWVLRGVQDSYALEMSNIFASRRFFVTEMGRMGIAASGTVVGDAIVIVRDYEYPLMVREGDGGRWRLVGQAYVEGVMYGEVLGGRVFEDIDIE